MPLYTQKPFTLLSNHVISHKLLIMWFNIERNENPDYQRHVFYGILKIQEINKNLKIQKGSRDYNKSKETSG